MEEKRLLIAIVLSILVFVVWHFFFAGEEVFKKSVPEKKTPPAAKEQPIAPAPITKEREKPASIEKSVSPAEVSQPSKTAKTIVVDTPLYRVKISEMGAAFTSFVLKKYRETAAENSPLKELLSADVPLRTVVLGCSDNSIPGLEEAVYTTDSNLDTLTIRDHARQVTFFWKSENGIKIEKTFNFSPQTYLIGLQVAVQNGSDQSLNGHLTLSLAGAVPKEKSRYGFEGPSMMINNKMQQIQIKKIAANNTFTGKFTWMELQDRYFMNSLIPKTPEDATVQLFLEPDQIIEEKYIQPQSAIQPGTVDQNDYFLFFGPMSMKILNQAGHDLGKALNFGMFDFIAKPCLWLMNWLYGIIPNYGVSIIILTLLIKILLWPLGSKSYKSMSEMKKIQPLMKEIREKYKNDRKKMNEEVMALYRTYKINPLGGCLPMVVQIPVFFALYRMLYQAIELRHAPFVLWINDLSAPDRLFRFNFAIPFMQPPYGIPVLTLLMGVTMLWQQKISPPMGDPAQAKMMMMMPLVFTVIFINFSSGLVLYWLVNNILSIAQQYYIQKKFA
jgi:YidC/Oxa1 family membrane protein insertase